MENFTDKTLGELLSNQNESIRRNAIGILKQLQKMDNENNKLQPETEPKLQKKRQTESKNQEKS
jgi:hypothetical protein